MQAGFVTQEKSLQWVVATADAMLADLDATMKSCNSSIVQGPGSDSTNRLKAWVHIQSFMSFCLSFQKGPRKDAVNWA